MATRDEPLDPQEVLEAAEAAHLAVRRTVPISRAREPDQPDPDDANRETVPLPRQRPASSGPRRAPLLVAAPVAALWAALVTFTPVAVVVTLLQAAAGGPLAVGAPVRVAAGGWLLAHGAPVQTAIGPVGLAPLALTAFAAWRMARAGVHVTRARGATGGGSIVEALLAAVAVAVGYGLIGVVMAVVVGGPGRVPVAVRAGLTLAVFGLVCAAYGALRATGALARWAPRIPTLVREGGRAGSVAAVGVLAAGAATAGTALAVDGGPAADVLAAYGTGVAGQAGLTLLCLAYAPNLSVWAAAYLVGPGFAVGTDTVVRNSDVALGPLPALPVFAALPTGPLPTVGAALLVAPVVAGGVSGWLLARATPGPGAWPRLVAGALLSGVVAGVLVGLAAAASGGPLGGGQLATIGPDPILVAGATVATVTPSALLGAAAAAVLSRRHG